MNYSKTSAVENNIYFLTQFLRVRNPGAAYLVCLAQGSLMRLQTVVRSTLNWRPEDLLPNSLKATSRRPQFFVMWMSGDNIPLVSCISFCTSCNWGSHCPLFQTNFPKVFIKWTVVEDKVSSRAKNRYTYRTLKKYPGSLCSEFLSCNASTACTVVIWPSSHQVWFGAWGTGAKMLKVPWLLL